LLRTTKNRYGPADEVACFEQTDSGLAEVSDPSALFRGQREHPVSGTCVTVTVDGRRPLPAEIQALVTAEPNGRRGVTGLDSARVSMLVAVTDRYLSPSIAARDTYVATIGGARILDPAADLAVCLAVASSALGTPIPADVLAIGVAEAARCGYTRILVPPGSRSRIGGSVPSATVVELPHLQGAVERVAHLAARG
jgi:DNA repair protein RadA/Sms